MRFTILNIAYPFAPVRSDTAGGAEQVLSMLDSSLVEAGHTSIVVASEDSLVRGCLVPTPRFRGVIDEETCRYAHRHYREAIEEALCRWKIDLIHMHGIDFEGYIPKEGVPVLVTLHLPLAWYSEKALLTEREGTYFNCVSATQRRTFPNGLKLLPDIENGVPLDLLSSKISKRRFALCLGRICPEKGFHIAFDAAKKAGYPLLLAGTVFRYETHENYFAVELLPRLDGKAYRFLGPVGLKRKRRLLSAARCLLVPSLAPETSSLVAMEALACGTPVVAFRSGALSEIVEDGRTGFLVRDEYEMAEAIKAASSLDADVCRKTAEERFSADAMTARYLSVYGNIVSGRVGFLFS